MNLPFRPLAAGNPVARISVIQERNYDSIFCMNTYPQVGECLRQAFPELSKDLPLVITAEQLPTVMRTFARLTRELFALGDIAMVRQCFKTAESLYVTEDAFVKEAIVELYLRLLGADWTAEGRLVIYQMLPAPLKKAYESCTHFRLAS